MPHILRLFLSALFFEVERILHLAKIDSTIQKKRKIRHISVTENNKNGIMHRLHLFIIISCLIFFLSSCKNSGQLTSQNQHEFTNALINETSPYLLQHAHNPVDWHAWNEESLEKAKKEDKLLIISIGYAACHWCHVMEHESFEDEEVAALMNEHFLPIKVDREERPDVDEVYMTACNLISGRGGWPLNAFALPNGQPVWAGTYFPKDKWIEILNQFITLKKNDPSKLEDSALRLTSSINNVGALNLVTIPEEFSKKDFERAVEKMNEMVDQKEGGRRGAPKFPMPNNYELLLKYGHMFRDDKVLHSALLTLDKMAYGGIYDQVGGGFARYSVDGEWKVPHFEKMLYDNAQLVGLYSMAYRLTNKPLYRKVVDQSLEFIDRELTSSEGGFYSSLDADSEGVEGKFYIWTERELDSILQDQELFSIAKKYYSTEQRGNWEHSNILHITQDPEKISKDLGISTVELNANVDKINSQLLKARENRIRPGLDDKILTGWNALMISGYVEAYKAFQNEKYLKSAMRNANFIVDNQLNKDYRLNRNYKEGRSTINAFLDDYAAVIKAFLDLYEVTFDQKWITKAQGISDYAISHFSNDENKMMYLSSDLDPPLVARSIESTDNVIPGTNSTMARNLFRLGEITYNKKYTERSTQMLANMYDNLNSAQQPGFYSNWLQLWLDLVRPPYEIVIVGADLINKAKEINSRFLGNSLVLGSQTSTDVLPLLEHKYVHDRTFIYVCENKVCQLPVEDSEMALSQIKFLKTPIK